MRKFVFILMGALLLFTGCSMFTGRFPAFPVDQTLTVNFSFPDLANEEFSDREKADQARDWLLYTVLSNSGLPLNNVAEATYDLAPVRYGFNSSLANFDYGETRAKFIGNGEVVALIPVSDEKTKNDHIAHVLDEVRKNQGEKPKKVFVFEYDLNTEGKFARITQRDELDAGDYFTGKMGYVEMPIRSQDDLTAFMNKTEDVTYTKLENGTLTCGGRHLLGEPYGKATPEDVAAIWQSEKWIKEKQAERESSLNNFDAEYKAARAEVVKYSNDEIKNLVFDDGNLFTDLSDEVQNDLIDYIELSVGLRTETGITNSDMYSSLFKSKASLPYKSSKKVARLIVKMRSDFDDVEKEYLAKAKALGNNLRETNVASASGFSLDPSVNFESAIEFVKDYRYWFEGALQPEYSVDQLLDQLRKKDDDLFVYATAKISNGLGAYVGLDKKIENKCLFQRARYDGSLQGTQAGMTLFYTDLLAKMWAANMFDSHPDVNITGFRNLEQTDIALPTVFKRESASLPNCRLWFGPNKNGFQAGEGKNELTFARNATQIFAKSSNPGSDSSIDNTGKKTHLEVQAAKSFEVVLNWWNNHFEEVGQLEPQYQRLNEIMKWSTIISWLNSADQTIGSYSDDQSGALNFLDTYPVSHSNWFPDWAKSKKDLQFNDWDSIYFYPRGSMGNKTESIPLLTSTHQMYSGGVSLAEKSLIKEAPELLPAEKSLFRRANLTQDFDRGENAFTTIKETKITIAENAGSKSVGIDLNAKEGYKLRNRFGEVENTAFKWDITQEPSGGFSFTSKLNQAPIGELRSTPLGKNGFTVGFESHAVDKGMAIAKQSSDFSGDIPVFLNNHPEVEQYIRAKDGGWCVKTKNDKEWMVMRFQEPGDEAATNLEKGWQARTSGSRLNSKIVEMKWVDEAEIKNLAVDLPAAKKPALTALDESPETLKSRLIKEKGEEAAKQELSSIHNKGISDAEASAAKNEWEEAVQQTNKLIRHFGPTPQLSKMLVRYRLQAGLQAIEDGNFNTAVNTLNEVLTTHPFKSGTEYFQEINRVIESAPLDQAVKDRILNIADVYFTDKHMVLPADWEGYKRTARQVTAINDAFGKSGAKIFYDEAAFGSIDPAWSFEQATEHIRTIPGVQVYDISAEAVGKNTRLYASIGPDLGGAAGRTGGTSTTWMEPDSWGSLKRQGLRLRVSPGSSSNNCKDDDNDGKCDTTYTVPGHVYYVTAPSLN